MALTVENVLIRALALIDELTTTGTRDTTKTADYAGKTPALVDMYQKELLMTSDLYESYELARKPVENKLSEQYTYDDYEAEELTYECDSAAYAYYFESDSGSGVAYVEDYVSGAWNTLATITMTNTTDGFNAYKGRVTPTTNATKSRLRFTGMYHYRTVNRALFAVPFEYGKNPDYAPYVKITLPTDARFIDKVILESYRGNYNNDEAYKIERDGVAQYLYINNDFEGKIRVQYRPLPTTITALTDTLQVDDTTANVMAYRLASAFMRSEQNNDAYKSLDNDYKQLKGELRIKQPTGVVGIVDHYGLNIFS
jgi:hypothetical protein